jgi:DNA-directed RNA polymerase specialized sigma24 family protein
MERMFAEPPEVHQMPRYVERIDAARWIRRAIERLSPKLWVVFVAVEIHGQTIVEVAKQLDIGLKAAFSRLELARAKLWRWVGNWVPLAA